MPDPAATPVHDPASTAAFGDDAAAGTPHLTPGPAGHGQTPLTERQQRERAFYAQYADRQRVREIDFNPVLSPEPRPWNPYWFCFQWLRDRVTDPPPRLLDFGCGIGIGAIRMARIGFDVDAFDLSPDNLAIARDLADRYGLSRRCRFHEMTAERLDFDDHTFDYVLGVDILHHVDIPAAVGEAARVLRPGGSAVFKEHVESPPVEQVRNHRLMRWLAPNETSLDAHITEDEHKLTDEDLRTIERSFDRVQAHRFTLLSRLDRVIPRCGDRARGWLQRLDHRLLNRWPGLAHLSGTVVLICHRPPAIGARARAAA